MTKTCQSFSFEFDYSDNHCTWVVEEVAELLPGELAEQIREEYPEEAARLIRSFLSENPASEEACEQALDMLGAHTTYDCPCAASDAEFEIEYADELLKGLPEGPWALDPSFGQVYDYTRDELSVEHLYNQISSRNGWTGISLKYEAEKSTLEARFSDLGRGSDSVTCRLLSPAASDFLQLWEDDSGVYDDDEPAAKIAELSDSLLELAVAVRCAAFDNQDLPQSLQDVLQELINAKVESPDKELVEVVTGLAATWEHSLGELIAASRVSLHGELPAQAVFSF